MRRIFFMSLLITMVWQIAQLPTPIQAQDPCAEGQVRVNGDCSTAEIATLPTGWSKIQPGGETACAYDTDYSYWVRPGTSERLLVYFQGGGGCWNEETCRDTGQEFNGYMDTAVSERDNPNGRGGILNLNHVENPFADDTIVYIPVCTGDVHWGDAVTSFGDDVEVHFKGFVNASSALEWAYANVPDPESVFITGCSAGSMGSIFHAPHIVEHYPDTPIAQVGDSLSLLRTGSATLQANWHAFDNLPEWIPGFADMGISEWSTAYQYATIGEAYPNLTFGEVNSAIDRVQVFYAFPFDENVDPWAWNELLQAHLNRLWESTPNYRSFTAGGNGHCLLPSNTAFYSYTVDGVRLVDWITALANGEDVDNLYCDDCTQPEFD